MAETQSTDAASDKPKNKRHRKDKPWDHEGIDHWKIEPYTEADAKGNTLVEETSFATMFPKYREQYLREYWPHVTRALRKHNIDCELNLLEGTMTVKTTRKTWDPYIIIKARDMLRLLSRSVPFPQAVRVLEDDMTCDIIKISGIVRNPERFAKRRQRLIGPDGATLKAIELITDCYVLVQGKTVAAMGSFKGLKRVRQIVIDCMNNIHPVYNIKRFMIKKELEKNPELKNENWDRFLPKFKKINVKRKKPVIKKKKEYNPFPPEQPPSKIDLQLESGEYFLKPAEREKKKLEEKKAKSEEVSRERRAKRAQAYVPPEEPDNTRKPRKQDEAEKLDVGQVKTKLRNNAPAQHEARAGDASQFLLASKKKNKDKDRRGSDGDD